MLHSPLILYHNFDHIRVLPPRYEQNLHHRGILTCFQPWPRSINFGTRCSYIRKFCVQFGTSMCGTELTNIELDSSAKNQFVKFGGVVEANQALRKVCKPDQYIWNIIINAYSRCGGDCIALDLYQQMRHQRIKPDKFTFLSILRACSSLSILVYVHEQVVENGFLFDIVVVNTLVATYAKCGCLEEACRLFDGLEKRDSRSWVVMISSYIQLGKSHLAIECYQNMQQQGITPSTGIFLSILNACGSLRAKEHGVCVHTQIIEGGLQFKIVLGNALVTMYAKCGNLEEAHNLFIRLSGRDIISWGAIIAGYVQNGEGLLALELFEKMQHESVQANRVIFLSILKACGATGAIYQGRRIHELTFGIGLQTDIVIANTLLDMYVKCGRDEEACTLFYKLPKQDVVSWSVMITGYTHNENWSFSLGWYESMQHEKIKPNKVTFLGVIKACGNLGAIGKGRSIHEEIFRIGLVSDIVVANAFVDMYAKCGSLKEAHRIFYRLANRDVVSWSSMITGYAQHGEGCLALRCFRDMLYERVKPNKVTFLSMLKACGSVGAMEEGRYIHGEMSRRGFEYDIDLGNALIDMYAKCGSLEEACKVFDEMPKRDVVSWDAMAAGHAQMGDGRMAIKCFEARQCFGIKMTVVSFNAILTAVGRAGLVDEALWYFRTMGGYPGMNVDMLHITCIMDLLGHAGYFPEAETLLQKIAQPSICLWNALLGACAIHCNVNLGRRCFDAIICLDAFCTVAYTLMSNIYASSIRREPNNQL